MSSSVRLDTPLGMVEVWATPRGICRVSLPRQDVTACDSGPVANAVLALARDQLQSYFLGQPVQFTCPLDIEGTPFQLRVWEVTRSIPRGHTVTYGEAAELAGYPGAARAVGGAMGANPVPIIVPCHRVVASGGRLGGFGGGLELKRALLTLEGYTVGERRRAR